MIDGKKIFIIDDDPIYRLIARKLIEKRGNFNSTQFFVNGRDGLSALQNLLSDKEDLPGTVLLDIEMPVMSGWQFMEEFVKLPDEVRNALNVFIVSSSVADEDRKKAETYPEIKHYITKPLTSETLDLIAETLGN